MGYFTRRALRRKWEGNRERDALRLSQQPQPQGVEVEEGLAYRNDGHPMHTLNLYRPQAASTPLPTVVDVHGGGWMYGDRQLNRSYCMYLASRGYAVMGMSYRLLPQTDLRGQVQDLFASLHWLSRYGEDHGFDLSRVLLAGDSAGGHLAALTACILQSPRLQALYGVQPPPLRPSALAILHGVCDIYHFGILTGAVERRVEREYLNMLLGRPWRRSPLNGNASFEDTAPGLALPPILVISSQSDRYYGQSRRLLDYLAAHSIPHQSIHWSSQQGAHLRHVFEVSFWDWPESRETNDKTLEFFDRCCQK